MLLICSCGQKLNTPGATPGRVGRCPRCGSLLKFDFDPVSESPGSAQPIGPARLTPAGATPPKPKPAPRRTVARLPIAADGLVAVPVRPEVSFLVCLNYPLRNAAGLALLGFLPPLLWFGSVPLFAIVPLLATGSAFSLIGLVLLGPQTIVLFFTCGHVLLFLGDVLVSSCLGAVAQPRQASWNPTEIVRAWGLWIWALLAGGLAGGWPALVYWLRCGDVDWLDQVILVDLILPGFAYAQMALVLALTEESPWSAANPLRVLGTVGTAGWGLFWPCLVTGSFAALTVILLKRCLEIGNEVLQAVGFGAWWLVSLYLAMVALRWLGLFCYRMRVVAIGPNRRSRG